MKNNLVLLILSVLTSGLLFCQPSFSHIDYPTYYRNMNTINDLLELGEFEKARYKFDSIVVLVKHVPSAHYFKMARISAERNNCELTRKYLLAAFKNGEEYGKGIRKHKVIIGCTTIVNELIAKEKEIHDKYFNYDYKAQIIAMHEEDQSVRTSNEFKTKGKVIDSLNMEKMLSLIDKYGYPSEKLIGIRSAFDAFIILLHMDRDTNNKIFGPILNEAYSDGYLWPNGYAWIVDRRRNWGINRLEPYYYHMPSPNYDTFSVEQKKLINIRRDSIGLRPKS